MSYAPSHAPRRDHPITQAERVVNAEAARLEEDAAFTRHVVNETTIVELTISCMQRAVGIDTNQYDLGELTAVIKEARIIVGTDAVPAIVDETLALLPELPGIHIRWRRASI